MPIADGGLFDLRVQAIIVSQLGGRQLRLFSEKRTA
jgi:hypothetical protein